NPQSIVDPRKGLDRGIDSPARFGHPRNFSDHRFAIEVFQLDFELLAPVRVLDCRVAANKALRFEHIEHAHPQPRGRYRHFRFVTHLRVVNTRDHVAERIVHSHRPALLTSLTSAGRESAPWSRDPEARCATAGACGRSRAVAPIPRNDCEYGSRRSCAAVPPT